MLFLVAFFTFIPQALEKKLFFPLCHVWLPACHGSSHAHWVSGCLRDGILPSYPAEAELCSGAQPGMN